MAINGCIMGLTGWFRYNTNHTSLWDVYIYICNIHNIYIFIYLFIHELLLGPQWDITNKMVCVCVCVSANGVYNPIRWPCKLGG